MNLGSTTIQPQSFVINYLCWTIIPKPLLWSRNLSYSWQDTLRCHICWRKQYFQNILLNKIFEDISDLENWNLSKFSISRPMDLSKTIHNCNSNSKTRYVEKFMTIWIQEYLCSLTNHQVSNTHWRHIHISSQDQNVWMDIQHFETSSQ